MDGAGLLLVFYAVDEQPWGFDPADRGGWRTVLVEDPASARLLEAPEGAVTTPERRITLILEPTLPYYWESEFFDLFNPQRINFDDVKGSDELFAATDQIEESRGLSVHQAFGWPTVIQNPMREEAQLASHGIYLGDADGYKGPVRRSYSAGQRSGAYCFNSTATTIWTGCGETSDASTSGSATRICRQGDSRTRGAFFNAPSSRRCALVSLLPGASAPGARASRRRASRAGGSRAARRGAPARDRRGTIRRIASGPPGRTCPDGEVRGDEADDLVSRCSAASRSSTRPRAPRTGSKRADLRVDPDAVPDEHAACAAHGDEGREHVRELALAVEGARVEQVVPVEEVQRRVSHRASAAPRRGAGQRRR